MRYVVQQFILTASPVGSRNITKKYDLGYSPATVRNIMSDLEDFGYINHPHTSAGRIPTDMGYRLYVDNLMDSFELTNDEKDQINTALEVNNSDTETLLTVVSRILSDITDQLACVVYPRFDSGKLVKIQLIKLSSTRLLVIITVESGLVKTITLEIDSDISEEQISAAEKIINERLAGLPLLEIRQTFRQRLSDTDVSDKPIMRIFFDSVDNLFKDFKTNDKVILSGAKNLLKKPEFENPENFQGIVELIENKDIIIHIVEKSADQGIEKVFVSIGNENLSPTLTDFSIVAKEYMQGGSSGMLGVIGPKRMEYEKMVAIVDFVSTILSEYLKKG